MYAELNENMEIFDINALNKEALMKYNYNYDIQVKDSEVFVYVK